MTKDRPDPSPEDLEAALRAINPVPDHRDLPMPDIDPVTGFVDGMPPGNRPAKRRRPAVRIGMLVAAALLIGATVIVVATRPVTDALGDVACFDAPSMTADAAIVAMEADEPAVSTCRNVLAEQAADGGSQVPEQLVECVLPTGAAAVFPAATCADVAADPSFNGGPGQSATPVPNDRRPLPPANPAGGTSTARVEQARDRIVDRFLQLGCVDETRARREARTILDEVGLADWQVNPVAPFTAQKPCASLYFDTVNRTVGLVPFPREP